MHLQINRGSVTSESPEQRLRLWCQGGPAMQPPLPVRPLGLSYIVPRLPVLARCVLACLMVSILQLSDPNQWPALISSTVSSPAGDLGAGQLLPGVYAAVSPGERQGLVNVYLATNGAGWNIQTGWSNYTNASVDPCTPTPWAGVSCDASGVSIT